MVIDTEVKMYVHLCLCVFLLGCMLYGYMHYECMCYVACIFCMNMWYVLMAQMLTHKRTCIYINVYMYDGCDIWVYAYVNVCYMCVFCINVCGLFACVEYKQICEYVCISI